MNDGLFSLEGLGIRQEARKFAPERMPKPIPLEKYMILCEKEEITCFFSEYLPFACIPCRINSGRCKGLYTVKIKTMQIENPPHLRFYAEGDVDEGSGPFQDVNITESFKDKINFICKLWVHGTAYAFFSKYFTVHLDFNKKYKKQIINDYNENILPFYPKNDTERPSGTAKKPSLNNKKDLLFSINE
jgi:hypothetical protein